MFSKIAVVLLVLSSAKGFGTDVRSRRHTANRLVNSQQELSDNQNQEQIPPNYRVPNFDLSQASLPPGLQKQKERLAYSRIMQQLGLPPKQYGWQNKVGSYPNQQFGFEPKGSNPILSYLIQFDNTWSDNNVWNVNKEQLSGTHLRPLALPSETEGLYQNTWYLNHPQPQNQPQDHLEWNSVQQQNSGAQDQLQTDTTGDNVLVPQPFYHL